MKVSETDWPVSQTLRIKNEEEWKVKKILAERRSDSGRVEYKVDWEGDYAPTWEPPECLEHAQDLVTAYKTRSARQSTKRGKKRKSRG